MDLSQSIQELYTDAVNFDNNLKAISKQISTGEVKLVDLVEQLGTKLTSKEVQHRVTALDILASIFAQLPKDYLTEKELVFIVDFLQDRIKDQHLVIPKVIFAIDAIIRYKNVPQGARCNLLRSVMQEISIQSHVHKVRRVFFLTIQYMLNHHLQELKTEMSTDFVISYLQCIEGEKDPRNLIVVFRSIPVILKTFTMGPFTEDFFEVLGCYFPIDFTPKADLPNKEVITRKELADALHKSLSCTNAFAEPLVPLILEKLNSNSVTAKLDSFELLTLCCERSFVPENLKSKMDGLWHSLRREIFMSDNEQVKSHALEFVKTAFVLLSNDSQILDHCLHLILQECEHHFSEPELRLIEPTMELLSAIACANECCCRALMKKVGPSMYKAIKEKSGAIWEQEKLLNGLFQLVKACRTFPSLLLSSLFSEWDEMKVLWLSLLSAKDDKLIIIGFKSFEQVLKVESDFTEKDLLTVQDNAFRTLFNPKDHDTNARESAISLLESIACQHSNRFEQLTLPQLLSKVDCGIEALEETSLHVLGECSHVNESICTQVMKTLLSSLSHNPVHLPALKCIERVVQLAYDECNNSSSSNSTLWFIPLMTEKLSGLEKVIANGVKLANELSNKGVQMKNDDGLNTTDVVAFDYYLLILRKLSRSMNIVQQEKFLMPLVSTDDVENWFNKYSVQILDAMFSQLRESLSNKIFHVVPNLLKVCLKNVIDNLTWEQREQSAARRWISVIVNKSGYPDATLEKFPNILATLDEYINRCFHELSKGCSDINNVAEWDISTEKLIIALSWVIKGMATSGSNVLVEWIEKLFNLLNYESTCCFVTEGCSVLMDDDPFSLNEESHCSIRMFYKQRIFLLVVPLLVKVHKNSTSQQVKGCCIQSMCALLEKVPSEVMHSQLENVFPILVASLKSPLSTPQILESSLKTLTQLLSSKDAIVVEKVKEYCHDIIPHVLKLTTCKTSLKVRKTSLACLQMYGKFPLHQILPFKEQIVQQLKCCLNDHKRMVRQEAVKTRNLWILVGAPGGF